MFSNEYLMGVAMTVLALEEEGASPLSLGRAVVSRGISASDFLTLEITEEDYVRLKEIIHSVNEAEVYASLWKSLTMRK